MGTIKCELCGGGLKIQAGGAGALCDSCGMEYSIERVKELISQNVETTTVSPSATQQNISVQQMDDFMKLAREAVASEEWNTATYYCNKIRELNFDDYRALVIISEIKMNRIRYNEDRENDVNDAISNYCKAVKIAPVEKKDDILNSVVLTMSKYTSDVLDKLDILEPLLGEKRCFDLCCKLIQDIFGKAIDDVEKQIIKYNQYEDHQKSKMTVAITLNNCSVITNKALTSILKSFHEEKIAPYVYVIQEHFTRLLNLFNKLKKFEYKEYSSGNYITHNIFAATDQEEYLDRYSEAQQTVSYFKKRISEILRDVEKKKNREYLREHPEEKTNLEEQYKKQQKKIENLKNMLENTPQSEDIKELKKKRGVLLNQIESLGFMQFVKKKQLINEDTELHKKISQLLEEEQAYVSQIEKDLEAQTKSLLNLEQKLGN